MHWGISEEKTSNKIPKILTLPIFSNGDTSMLTLPIYYSPLLINGDPNLKMQQLNNPLFGVRIRSNTQAVGAFILS